MIAGEHFTTSRWSDCESMAREFRQCNDGFVKSNNANGKPSYWLYELPNRWVNQKHKYFTEQIPFEREKIVSDQDQPGKMLLI